MNFLGLSFLFALPLVAIPVIIHLYRGRQRDIIPWGAMQFLEKATTKGRSMQRLEELLLMFLRVAALLALVLALARPVLHNSWFGSGVDREVVLVLDNSLSMARTVEDLSANEQMIEKASELINDFSASDTVHLLTAAGGGQWLSAEGIAATSTGKNQLIALVQEIAPTLGSTDLLQSLQTVVNMEPRDNPAARHILVLSDNQSQSWQPESESVWQQLGKTRENFPIPTTIEVITCETDEAQFKNLAVMELEASRQLARPKERIEFTAKITNVGEVQSGETILEWLVGDQVFDTSRLRSLAADESTRVTTEIRQKEAGHFAVTCRIKADDQIDLDRASSVVIEVSDQLPILIVHNQIIDEYSKSADELFTTALGYKNGQPQSYHSVYRPELASVAELADKVLNNYRAIVILGLSELPGDSQERLQDFVQSGGGLWVTLGEQVDRDTFNRNWHDDGGGLSPFALASLVSVPDTNQPEGSIHPPEREHPATKQLANTTQLDIDEARLSEYWQLIQSGTTDPKRWIMLESGNGNPLVIENIYGNGRVLIQAFPLDLTWSNLPQLKSYVVMVYDWLNYITAPTMSRYNLEPGNAILAHVPAGFDLTAATLLTPTEQEVTLASTGDTEGGLVRYSQTQLPGLYQVTLDSSSGEVSFPFHVARNSSESRWSPLAANDRTRLAEMAGLQFEDMAPSTATTATTQIPTSTEPLWGALLLLLVALLFGEQLMSHWLAQRRSGVAVTVN